MAKKNEKNNKGKVPAKAKAPATLYSRSEILGAASSFGVNRELLAGALSLSDEKDLSKSDVNGLIKKFKERKVQ